MKGYSILSGLGYDEVLHHLPLERQGLCGRKQREALEEESNYDLPLCNGVSCGFMCQKLHMYAYVLGYWITPVSNDPIQNCAVECKTVGLGFGVFFGTYARAAWTSLA